MMKHFLYSFLLIGFQLFSQNDWEKRLDKQGIQVFLRNHESSTIKEYKVVGVFNCDMQSFIEVINNDALNKDWTYSVNESYEIKRDSVNEGIIYGYVNSDLPWPFKDRDGVFKHELVYKSSTEAYIYFESTPLEYPNVDNRFRIKKFKGSWRVIDTDKGLIAEQTVFADLELPVPDFIVNLFIDKGPYWSFKKLTKLVSKQE